LSIVFALCLGAAVAWLGTYLSLTRESRLISRIREDAAFLSLNHDGGNYYNCGVGDRVVTDKEILKIYRWANKTAPEYKLNSERLTAETIVCEKILGLTLEVASYAAVRVLRGARSVDAQTWGEDLGRIARLQVSLYDRIKEENPGASEDKLVHLYLRDKREL
jgi:hypothetical protein